MNVFGQWGETQSAQREPRQTQEEDANSERPQSANGFKPRTSLL